MFPHISPIVFPDFLGITQVSLDFSPFTFLGLTANYHVLRVDMLTVRFPIVSINNRNTRTRWETCFKLTVKRPEQHQWRRSGVFIVNLTYFTPCPSLSIAIFIAILEQVNAGWVLVFVSVLILI